MTDQGNPAGAQPGDEQAVAAGCTCPTDQPRASESVYQADGGCPLHGLGMVAAELGVELPESDLMKRARDAALARQERVANEKARLDEGHCKRFAADLRLFFGVDVEADAVVITDGYYMATIDEITFRRGSMQSTDYVWVDAPTGWARVRNLAELFIAMTLPPKKVEPEPVLPPEPDDERDPLDLLVDALEESGLLDRIAERIR